MTEALTVDDLTFEVRRSARRRTIQITVDRNSELIISAPPDIDEALLADFVREKRFWLYTKLAEKNSCQQPVVGKAFVSGEGFPYLGRSYHLLLVAEQGVTAQAGSGRVQIAALSGSAGKAPVYCLVQRACPRLDESATRGLVEPHGC